MQRLAPEDIDISDLEYRAIERALLETARGRWFLAEHSRRSRRMETASLEEAIVKLKSSLRCPPALLGRLQGDLEATVAEIAETRSALLSRSPPGEGRAATAAILKAGEELHERIWALQTRDVDGAACAAVGRSAAAILALSTAQAQESDRAKRFAAALDTLSDRLVAALASIDLEAGEPGGETEEPAPVRAIGG